MDTNNYITLKKLTQEILFETDRDEGFYKKCMHYIINGIREMNKFHYNNIRTLEVEASSNGTIALAGDFIEIVNVAIAYNDVMYPLTRREDMIMPEDAEDDAPELDTGGDYVYSTTGGKNDFYYSIDERENKLIVSNTPTRKIFYQYITSGIEVGDTSTEIHIPIKLKDALKYYVLYKDALTSDFGNKKLVMLYKQEYNEEVSKLEFLTLPTATELLDILYETYRPLRR